MGAGCNCMFVFVCVCTAGLNVGDVGLEAFSAAVKTSPIITTVTLTSTCD